jgi:hypothetical protein
MTQTLEAPAASVTAMGGSSSWAAAAPECSMICTQALNQLDSQIHRLGRFSLDGISPISCGARPRGHFAKSRQVPARLA